MSDFQKYIEHGAPSLDPDKEFRTKDGAHFEEALHYWWGATATRMPFGIKKQFRKLGEKFGWLEVYDVVKFAAEMDKKNYRYVEVSLEKRVIRAKEKATAQKKKLVHCPKCYEGYWSDMRHECTIEFLDEPLTPLRTGFDNTPPAPSPEGNNVDVHEQVMKLKEQWRKELGEE